MPKEFDEETYGEIKQEKSGIYTNSPGRNTERPAISNDDVTNFKIDLSKIRTVDDFINRFFPYHPLDDMRNSYEQRRSRSNK